jgi:hypothetical protein
LFCLMVHRNQHLFCCPDFIALFQPASLCQFASVHFTPHQSITHRIMSFCSHFATPPHFISFVHFSSCRCASLHFLSVQFAPPHITSTQSTINSVHFIRMTSFRHFTSLQFTSLHFSSPPTLCTLRYIVAPQHTMHHITSQHLGSV